MTSHFNRYLSLFVYVNCQEWEERPWPLDYTKLKSLCPAKKTINKMKKQPAEWENIFANHISDKGLICKIYKESMQQKFK